jgi:hypothetical protein
MIVFLFSVFANPILTPSHWENDQIFWGVRGTVDVDGTGECIFDP